MGGRSAYVLLSVALFAAALAAGVATWLEWLPCRGAMLNGSILLGYQYPSDFSDACLMRMDGDDTLPLAPGTLEARALSALLLGLGWLGYALRLRLPMALRAVVLLPVLPIGWFAAQTWSSRGAGAPAGIAPAMILIEVTTFVALVVICLKLTMDDDLWPSLIGLWAVGSYGVLRYLGEYIVMITFSDANWDTPPGTGYLTAAVIAGCGLLVALLGSRITSTQTQEVRSQLNDLHSSVRPSQPQRRLGLRVLFRSGQVKSAAKLPVDEAWSGRASPKGWRVSGSGHAGVVVGRGRLFEAG